MNAGLRFTVQACLVLAVSCLTAQQGTGGTERSPGFQENSSDKWTVDCNDRFCLLSADVMINDADHPSDPSHPKTMGIVVEMNRSTRKPESFAFFVPPYADRKQGVLINFADAVKSGDSSRLVVAKDALSQLDFTQCQPDFCVARVHSEILDDNGKVALDLLDEFLRRNQVWLLFTRKGSPYRGMSSLLPFQEAYKNLMETAMKSPQQ